MGESKQNPLEWIQECIEVFEFNEEEQLYFAKLIMNILSKKPEEINPGRK